MGALGINLPGLITQIVSFSILFILLWFLLYKPITRAMRERSGRIREGLEAAEKARAEAADARAAMEEQITAARAEGQEMIAQARQVADRFREEELAKAREEIRSERERAEADIQRERDAAIEGLRREFAAIAVDAAEKIIERSIDETAHSELIDKVLEDSGALGRSQ